MKYELTIISKEPNKNFDAELEEWIERNKYNSYKDPLDYPKKEVSGNTLIVSLTEEQFEVVKKAVLETFV